MKRSFYIAIEGNIGAGKTTLAKILAERNRARLVLEEFEENPFLKGFYKDPERYAFSVEMSFLADRYHQLSHLVSQNDMFQPHIIADYAPFKSLIFAQNNLTESEFKLYREFWQMSLGKLPKPDLIVYLAKPVEALQRNILLRGRSYESNIDDDYLMHLAARYEEYFRSNSEIKRLYVDSEHIDFISVSESVAYLEGQIEEKLKGVLK